jgi:hypothetical protein
MHQKEELSRRPSRSGSTYLFTLPQLRHGDVRFTGLVKPNASRTLRLAMLFNWQLRLFAIARIADLPFGSRQDFERTAERELITSHLFDGGPEPK